MSETAEQKRKERDYHEAEDALYTVFRETLKITPDQAAQLAVDLVAQYGAK